MPNLPHANLGEVFRFFFRLGCTAFGGPAAHIAMLQRECVQRRQWLTEQEFLDYVGAVNLIPGPNSTELAMLIGRHRAGAAGLVVGGLAFIFPAACITGLLAWGYVHWGTRPAAAPWLAGVRCAIWPLILLAVIRLGRKACHTPPLFIMGGVSLLATLAGLNEIAVLFSIALLGALLLVRHSPAPSLIAMPPISQPMRWGLLALTGALVTLFLWPTPVASPPGQTGIALYFLKIGSILYGSGYVLFALLQGGLVRELHWLTQPQLVDAIAAGQFTPGPVFTTATFIGYLLRGAPGALVASLAIFLPPFCFAALLHPLLPRLRAWRFTSAFLDAVNATAMGLMAAVGLQFAWAICREWRTALLSLALLAVSARYAINSAWLVLAGAVLGALFLR
jgi:chromate transporter